MLTNTRGNVWLKWSVGVVLALLVFGCGSVKKATDSSSSGGSSSPRPITAADCVWVSMNTTAMPWGSGLSLDMIDNKLALTYNAEGDESNRVRYIWSGSAWSEPISFGPADEGLSLPATYTIAVESSEMGSYYSKLSVKENGVEIYSFEGDAFETFYQPQIVATEDSLYIAYSMYSNADERNGLYLKKLTIGNLTAENPINFFVHGTVYWNSEFAFKVVSDTEAYLAWATPYLESLEVFAWGAK